MPDGVRPAGFIESTKNERIRRYRRLLKRNFRYREGLFLAEGMKAVAESLMASRPPECILCDEKGLRALEAYSDYLGTRNIPCFQLAPPVMELLASTVTPQGVVAVCPMLHRPLEEMLAEAPPVVLVADRVRDPGNLGTMVRVADAAGTRGVVVCSESVDLYNPKAVRSTAGSIFHVPVCVGLGAEEALARLKEAGYTVLVADAREGTVVWEMEWPARTALVMGNEAWGVPEKEGEMADGRVKVPIAGRAESLNVAAATAVILYEILRRRWR